VAIAAKSSGTRVQTWLPKSLAEQLRAQAELERRTVSAIVRLAIEDRLGPVGQDRLTGGAMTSRRVSFHAGPVKVADSPEPGRKGQGAHALLAIREGSDEGAGLEAGFSPALAGAELDQRTDTIGGLGR
jgi:hypothetical protein